MAIDATDGTRLWGRVFPAWFGATPVASGHLVYVLGGNNGSEHISAYRHSTGKRAWRFDLPDSLIGGQPAVANGVVYLGWNGSVLALDAISGERLWRSRLGMPVPVDVGVSIANGVVYVGADKLYALDAATGSILWTNADGHPMDTYWFPPAIANGMVYASESEAGHDMVHAYGLP
jgi:outer membrane protein assembly factor BamB